jgi:hypothetical protein
MRLRFAGLAHTSTYAAHGRAPWQVGESREVPDDEGAALLADFPGAFVAIDGGVRAEALGGPVADAAMASPSLPGGGKRARRG